MQAKRETMDDLNYSMFHGYLGRECVFVLKARDELERILEMRRAGQITDENRKLVLNDFWYAVDALLTATANISKTLWGTTGCDEDRTRRVIERGQKLRLRLKFNESSALKSRDIRNYFEHFDEAIDQFCQVKHECVYDSNVRPFREFKDIRNDSLRNFDPDTRILYTGNQRLNFKPLIKAIVKLQGQLESHLPPEEPKLNREETGR